MVHRHLLIFNIKSLRKLHGQPNKHFQVHIPFQILIHLQPIILEFKRIVVQNKVFSRIQFQVILYVA